MSEPATGGNYRETIERKGASSCVGQFTAWGPPRRKTSLRRPSTIGTKEIKGANLGPASHNDFDARSQ